MVTFKFSHWFVLKLVTKVSISCQLKVLTSRLSFSWSDFRGPLSGCRGHSRWLGPWCSGSVGKWLHFPFQKHFCLKYLLSDYFVPVIVTITNKTFSNNKLLSITPTSASSVFFCDLLPGCFSWLWLDLLVMQICDCGGPEVGVTLLKYSLFCFDKRKSGQASLFQVE